MDLVAVLQCPSWYPSWGCLKMDPNREPPKVHFGSTHFETNLKGKNQVGSCFNRGWSRESPKLKGGKDSPWFQHSFAAPYCGALDPVPIQPFVVVNVRLWQMPVGELPCLDSLFKQQWVGPQVWRAHGFLVVLFFNSPQKGH